MTITITAVMYSRVESKPENTSLKSAKYPAGPVTYALSPPVSARAMERISSTRGASSSQPLPSSATLIGTTTCNARPSSDGTGPMTLPVTSWSVAKRLASAAALAWSAAATGPSGRSYTTRAGNTSLGVNCLASSTTWVDSALLGSQAEASFCWALFSLPASGPATANTTTQNPRTTHLVRRPLGRLTIRRTPLMTPPTVTPHTIDHGLLWPEQVNRHPIEAIPTLRQPPPWPAMVHRRRTAAGRLHRGRVHPLAGAQVAGEELDAVGCLAAVPGEHPNPAAGSYKPSDDPSSKATGAASDQDGYVMAAPPLQESPHHLAGMSWSIGGFGSSSL